MVLYGEYEMPSSLLLVTVSVDVLPDLEGRR